ncbi:MAG TPA: AAA family ATPase [Nitrososphaera sp.]|nr:AAA family ATPase [Nitrososphaera sp.]
MPEAPQIPLQYNLGDMHISQYQSEMFWHAVSNARLPHCSFVSVHSELEDPSELFDEIHGRYGKHLRGTIDGCMVFMLPAGSNVWYISLAGHDFEQLKKLGIRIKEFFPPLEEPDESILPLSFWADSAHGPTRRTRKIIVPSWSDISVNYCGEARDRLDEVMTLAPPIFGGRLILWHGPPGTGKTHAIRALCRSWRKWCRASYIVDPEKFFGVAAYMLQVILDEGDDDWTANNHVAEADEKRLLENYRLLIIEDADELIQKDAKNRTGQSLSRLLNLADGLIGQGLNLLILITTNEPIHQLHPAIRRPGRCLANVQINAFSPYEARLWLARNKADDTQIGEGVTLAELYERLGTKQINFEAGAFRAGTYL